MDTSLASSRGALKRLRVLLLCAGLAVSAGGAGLPEHVRFAPEPAWVERVPVRASQPSSKQEMIKDGIQHLLLDNQIRLGETNATYCHTAYRFETEAGIRENASVQVVYDPTYQTVVFHRLSLLRRGQTLDCLKEGAFRVLQRENNLEEEQLLDGRTTLLAVLEDLRVNDVLEYAYTVIGDNPIFAGRYSGSFTCRWSVPLLCQRLRVLIPEGRKLQRQQTGEGVREPSERQLPGFREFLWQETNSPPMQVEGETPVWYQPLPEVSLSEYASWADVAQWAASCYRLTNRVDETLVPQLAAWRNLESEASRVGAALDFVQNEIRYFGLELGPGSYRPNPPALVLQRRFGDCKDKSVLLCALLTNLGIHAQPALVNVFLRDHVAGELPSPLAFNHVIVRARIDGQQRWMDPTRTQQRGPVEKRYLPPYGQALVVDATTTALEPVSGDNFSHTRTQVHEQFDLRGAGDGAKLTVRSQFLGRDAEQNRERFANNSRSDLERSLLNYYAQRFADVEQTQAMTVEDDAASNRIATTEHYMIRTIWHPDATDTNVMKVRFNAQELSGYVNQPETVLRKTPLGLPYPIHIQQTIEVLLPEEWGVDLSQETLQDPYLCFTATSSYSNKVLTLHYQLQTKSNNVPLAKVAEHLKLRRKIAHSLDYEVSKNINPQPVFKVNWPLAGIFSLWCGLLVVLWIVGYRYAPEPLPLPSLPEGQVKPLPQGIGGWLILPCIGLVGSLFLTCSGLIQLKFCFDLHAWQALTTPGNSAYHELWAATLWLELFGNSFQLALVTLCGVLLLRHRASLPRFMVLLYVSGMLLVCMDSALSLQIPEVAKNQKAGQMTGDVNRTVIACCIWIPYFLTSRRVRNTFRK